MEERTPLFVKPLNPSWHLLLLFALLAIPVYASLAYGVFTHPIRRGIEGEIGAYVMILLSLSSIVLWAVNMGRYLGHRFHWHRAGITATLVFVVVLGYLFELVIILFIGMNAAAEAF